MHMRTSVCSSTSLSGSWQQRSQSLQTGIHPAVQRISPCRHASTVARVASEGGPTGCGMHFLHVHTVHSSLLRTKSDAYQNCYYKLAIAA